MLPQSSGPSATDGGKRKVGATKDGVAARGACGVGIAPMVGEAEWVTSNAVIGVGHHDHGAAQRVRELPVAGVGSVDAAYHGAANDFPRFERQKIRGIYDEAIIDGSKQPHPELLRRFPNRERHPPEDYGGEAPMAAGKFLDVTANAGGRASRTQLPPQRPSSGRSGRSRTSGVSRRSDRSDRSVSLRSAAACSIGSRSSAASSSRPPPPGFFRQAPEPSTRFTTSSAAYGACGPDRREPAPGRETWMLGRGGGQLSSFDNCLVDKSQHVPLSSMV